ncbi:ImmA/IrrE family metallo-endopeptidase [Acidithiobacillus caldus]|uniref:IrrE N-terminal-like domain-containing protein n=1 Tax=Acidithiobacillus caldus TaxID=33059 RepID=A0A1E7YQI0_9PROT|nr:ImmA/IrrE family metallo-endopeptidase [Acidithiobacillus caldus]OFC30207.1 hypothetical protein BAE28_14870 [Acidithiobacillus caldus]OFC35673.1 hypothetical protein BAE29_14775 [Acidithiobacillus caldus]OFC38467.1 hypothetical protein BAE27_02070 [Acidithiobacillus caldus]
MDDIFRVVHWWDVQGLAEYEGELCEATLADLTIKVGSACLTRNALLDNGEWYARESVRLCLHPLAHWLAWNFYRLLYEPLPETQGRALPLEWLMAHDMAYVGDGFLWPPVRIYSDGARMTLRPNIAQVPSLDPVQYTSTVPVILPVQAVEDQILRFLETCDIRLRGQGMKDSPFQVVYGELKEELKDVDVRLWRQSEAMLGFDPDDAPEKFQEAFYSLIGYLGRGNTAELAANGESTFIPAEGIQRRIREAGTERHPQDVGISVGPDPTVPAWVKGMEAARTLRQDLAIHGEISDERLAEIYGVPAYTLQGEVARSEDIRLTAYSAEDSRIVLGAGRRRESRRFAIARLLGDEILREAEPQFRLVTRSKTYRQKFQRAFAAELLCPREEVLDRLSRSDGDEDVIEDVAEQFGVSDWVVRHALENDTRLDPLDKTAA